MQSMADLNWFNIDLLNGIVFIHYLSFVYLSMIIFDLLMNNYLSFCFEQCVSTFLNDHVLNSLNLMFTTIGTSSNCFRCDATACQSIKHCRHLTREYSIPSLAAVYCSEQSHYFGSNLLTSSKYFYYFEPK